jgi:hypothetical protein
MSPKMCWVLWFTIRKSPRKPQTLTWNKVSRPMCNASYCQSLQKFNLHIHKTKLLRDLKIMGLEIGGHLQGTTLGKAKTKNAQNIAN